MRCLYIGPGPVRGPGIGPGRLPLGILHLSSISCTSWIYRGYTLDIFGYILPYAGTCLACLLHIAWYIFWKWDVRFATKPVHLLPSTMPTR